MDSKKLIVNMAIPVITEPLVSVPEMTFYRWLPIKEEDFIISEEDNIAIKIWFDENVTSPIIKNEKDISKTVNVTANKVYIDAIISDIDPKLLAYIQKMNPKKGPTSDQKEIHSQYYKLGAQVYKATLKNYNLLIKYFRDVKGQYWLEEYPMDTDNMSSSYLKFKAKAKVINGDWFLWKPSMKISITAKRIDENRYIKEEEWKEVKEFITSNKRSPLIWNLIAGAEKLSGNEYNRSALTEAITALEVSLYEFAEKAYTESIFQEKIAERVEVKNLRNFIDHLGLSGSVNYLLPLLFTEKQIPAKLLKNCKKALTVRNNVVHNGQRDVDENNLNEYIESIRKICIIFENFSRE